MASKLLSPSAICYRLSAISYLLFVVACGSGAPATNTAVPPTLVPTAESTAAPTETPGPFTLLSEAFETEGEIPVRHAQKSFTAATDSGSFVCPGGEVGQENASPALSWVNVPRETKSFSLIMVDDMHFAYPDAPEGTFFPHWVVYNLPPDSTGLTERQPAELSLPEGRGLQGLNGYPAPYDQGYGGPCPGPGEKHLYIFTLYALDTSPGLPPGAQYEEVLKAMEGHILEQVELRGYYTGG